MKVDYKRRIIKWTIRQFLLLMIIAWMFIIFGFSSEDGESSQSLSDVITYKVIDVIYPDYDSYSADRQEAIRSDVSFLVRKTGHFGEYAILGLLIATFMLTFKKIRKRIRYVVIGEAVCIIYAITDEVHQGFVDGRSPKLMDVGIDSAGAMAGIFTAALICVIICRLKKPLSSSLSET